ncbi:Hypp1927 [Branchiostoma lanceolatum]|uniref:Hypp1927 protein n=1 Tax=Branchiostoma lanceolatum TaxID=7740 RepID=A0A8J9ZLY5_BRALA|nr:Hypp1927 [Branchiostoma lanceolatum]
MSATKETYSDAARDLWETTNDDYEKFRPSHDEAGVRVLLEHLGLVDNVNHKNGTLPTDDVTPKNGDTPVYDVLDVGAGTGKCTRVIKDILGENARIVALDPVAGMIKQLKAMVPGVDAFVGPCESIPLPDNSVKAVVSSQSFHFYANESALREIHRVLIPGGKFGINFTADDEASPLVHGVYELVRKYMYPDCPETFLNPLLDTSWKNCFDAAPLFTPLEEHIFPWENQQTLPDAESVVKLFMTYSAIAREPDVRKECAERMLELLTTDPAIKQNGNPLEVPRLNALFWCTKKVQ